MKRNEISNQHAPATLAAVRIACAERGFNFKDLAERAGIPASVLSLKLNGKRAQERGFREALERALDLEAGTLAGAKK